MTTRLFVDANVLVEVIEERANFEASVAFLRKNAGNMYISALTVHLVMYFCRKVTTTEHLQAFLSDFYITPITSSEVTWAFNNLRSKDFEDALQIASALLAGCEQFVTFDRGLIKRYGSELQLTFVTPRSIRREERQ